MKPQHNPIHKAADATARAFALTASNATGGLTDANSRRSAKVEIHRSPIARPLGLLTRDQVMAEPDAIPIIHGLIDKGRLAMIAGPSGSGKSVLQLHLCAALLNEGSVFGHRIPKPVRFLYINLEGDLKHRLMAVEKYHQDWVFPAPAAMFMTRSWLLSDEGAVEALAQEVKLLGGVDVIFVDTLNRAMTGSEENSSADMGQIIANAQLLIQRTGAAVVLTHHTGKAKERGPRGHSSLFAALDTCLMVDKTSSGMRTFELTKTRNGSEGTKHYFEIDGVLLGEDRFGLPLQAPALKVLEATPEVLQTAKSPPLSDAHKAAHVAIACQLMSDPNGPKASLPFADALDSVKRAFASRYESKHRSTRARQAIDTLIEAGKLIRENDQIMLREEAPMSESHKD